MTKDDLIKMLTAMKSTSTETVWKSADECKGYLKAIDEINLMLEEISEEKA